MAPATRVSAVSWEDLLLVSNSPRVWVSLRARRLHVVYTDRLWAQQIPSAFPGMGWSLISGTMIDARARYQTLVSSFEIRPRTSPPKSSLPVGKMQTPGNNLFHGVCVPNPGTSQPGLEGVQIVYRASRPFTAECRRQFLRRRSSCPAGCRRPQPHPRQAKVCRPAC